jgi:hypothetical protein
MHPHDYPFSGAAVRSAKPLGQYLDFQSTDHPRSDSLDRGRCSFICRMQIDSTIPIPRSHRFYRCLFAPGQSNDILWLRR